MAMTNTTSLPKFLMMMRELGLYRNELLGYLEMLWQNAHHNSSNLDGPVYIPGAIEAIIDWHDGPDGVFEAAAIKYRWIDATEDGNLKIHDYRNNCPYSTIRRISDAEKRRVRRGCVNDTSTIRQPSGDDTSTDGLRTGDEKPQELELELELEQEQESNTNVGTFPTVEDGSESPQDVLPGIETPPKPQKREDGPVAFDSDPLGKLSDLAAYHETARMKILANHPHAKLPVPGSRGWRAERETLEQIHRLDAYPEADIVATLEWVLDDPPVSPGGFCWKDQVASICGLRTRKDGRTKFDKIHETMICVKKKKTGNTTDCTDEVPFS